MKKNNSKTHFLSVLSALMILLSVFFLCSCSAEAVEPDLSLYKDTRGEKLVLSSTSDPWTSYFMEPGLEACVHFAKAAISGKITDIKVMDIPFTVSEKFDEKMSPDGKAPTLTVTRYTIDVDKYFIGSGEKQIIVQIAGDLDSYVTKPKEKCGVVMFLDEYEDGIYKNASSEDSIFIKNSKDKLYSLSDIDQLSAYDGADLETLINDTKKLIK